MKYHSLTQFSSRSNSELLTGSSQTAFPLMFLY